MADVLLVGAAGYAGGELLRLLLQHPGIGSLTLADKLVDAPTHPGAIYPYLRGLDCPDILPEIPEDPAADAALLATPDGVTMRLAGIVGDRGQDWHLLTSAAFVTMLLPLTVFFSLQRFFVRGLLAGSVKG